MNSNDVNDACCSFPCSVGVSLFHLSFWSHPCQAKNICDILVVGIHSDQEIAENKSMPVMRQEERYRLLDHIKWIDEILYDVPYSPEIATLERARADFCIHGDDMPVNSQGFCAYDEMRNAGRLRIIKRTEGVSTTDLIGRLLTLSRNQPSDLGGASPTMGLRMSADEVIEAAAAGDSNAVKLLRESVQQLVAKYHISSQDAAALQDQIQTLETVLNQKPRDLRDMQDKGDESQSQGQGGYARTQVPVQLLASTRRIREFSSAKQPTSDDCVVYVSGSFDMFHVGHAEFLKDARELGTFLLVGIHDDASISKAKGQNLPVMNLNERVPRSGKASLL
jgi:ethanolamine-phosphate cytidylyltransferase